MVSVDVDILPVLKDGDSGYSPGGCVRSAWRSSCAATAAHVQTKEG